ncbi:SOS response-associated peptidase [Tessaracoccus sp. MC1865]|uniref:SOS response-associated peptidase n=1 Tax=Tessaracoccus sp. MC1865 TaxID=2760310 RepID=UPI0015FF3C16|nr:SOS response-associated peptidase [Tessaracoccus sp. MC1865]MBB1484893.1 SOS response-associated peptidase [Tessaracoccus sp. MC1865]QTO38707.1 SOS response-associated peptidase [Tessaracoccus sp. MC1865]
MCGRYAATAHPSELVEEFEISFIDEEMAEVATPRFNIAPTDVVPAVVDRAEDGGVTRKLVPLKWGLVPSWSKSPDGGARLINARVETVAEKPSFRKAASARRCLLPALGYYEWRSEDVAGKKKPVKQPYFLSPPSGLMVMAGLYEFWKGPDGWLSTTTIITTEATDELGWVHDRMPMVVPRDSWDDWLDPAFTDAQAAVAMLTAPLDLGHRKVSRTVNKVGTEGPELIEPVS